MIARDCAISWAPIFPSTILPSFLLVQTCATAGLSLKEHSETVAPKFARSTSVTTLKETVGHRLNE